MAILGSWLPRAGGYGLAAVPDGLAKASKDWPPAAPTTDLNQCLATSPVSGQRWRSTIHETGPDGVQGVLAVGSTGRACLIGREVSNVDVMDNRNEIREFLTRRRARISPEQAGLRDYGGHRRVPGLCRGEVAMLAGVSPEYYTRWDCPPEASSSEAVGPRTTCPLHERGQALPPPGRWRSFHTGWLNGMSPITALEHLIEDTDHPPN
jgi:hypothetical protein